MLWFWLLVVKLSCPGFSRGNVIVFLVGLVAVWSEMAAVVAAIDVLFWVHM